MGTRMMRPAFPPLTPGVKALLIVLGVAFGTQLIVASLLGFDRVTYQQTVIGWLGLSLPGVLSGRLWQVVTYMFLHSLDGWGHVLMNALGLYFFGTALEEQVGKKVLFKIAFGAGVAGAVAVLAVQAVGISTGAWAPIPVVGASGAISGVLGAFCWLHWDRTLYLFFVRMQGKHLLALVVLVDAIRLFAPSQIAVHCHYGGLAYGLLWITGWTRPRTAMLGLRRLWLKRKLKVVHRQDDDERPRYLN